ncbi:Bcr/CflA family drug resistance efflux transporter [Camelimonas fluminis]|uniref:Bcr/CflA family efflux transporter n=1 Tax=Camelimonas fluminis TaxID=1576911 RepID=A0ABV7UE33_9HYPH|nr:multidrug effflux MFS transporter [Camelimonas fluminis]GHE51654.1 Bcr/CflA family drug resistance efflux transporter [Camelimonas fluminis]
MARPNPDHPQVAGASSPARSLSPGLIALLAGFAAVGVLSTNIMLPAFPAIATALRVAPRDLGVTLSSFFIVFALGQVFVGPVSDRFGRRRVIVSGLGLFLLGSAICGVATSLEVLVAGRVIQALGVCATSVLARAIARDLFDGDMLAKALSMIMVAMAAAPGFSPLVGGLIATFFDWRMIFLLVSIVAVILLVAYVSKLGETHPPDRRAPLSLSNVVGAYAALAVDVRFICPALAVSLIIGGLYATFAAAPVILMAEIGMTPIQYGLFTAATVFVVFGAGLAAPRLAARFGALTMAHAGAVLAAAGGLLLLLTYRQPNLVAYTASIVIFLLGMGMANPLGTAIALRPFGERAGLASALIGFLQMAAAAATTALASSLPLATATVLGAMQLCGGLAALALLGQLARAARKAPAIAAAEG